MVNDTKSELVDVSFQETINGEQVQVFCPMISNIKNTRMLKKQKDIFSSTDNYSLYDNSGKCIFNNHKYIFNFVDNVINQYLDSDYNYILQQVRSLNSKFIVTALLVSNPSSGSFNNSVKITIFNNKDQKLFETIINEVQSPIVSIKLNWDASSICILYRNTSFLNSILLINKISNTFVINNNFQQQVSTLNLNFFDAHPMQNDTRIILTSLRNFVYDPNDPIEPLDPLTPINSNNSNNSTNNDSNFTQESTDQNIKNILLENTINFEDPFSNFIDESVSPSRIISPYYNIVIYNILNNTFTNFLPLSFNTPEVLSRNICLYAGDNLFLVRSLSNHVHICKINHPYESHIILGSYFLGVQGYVTSLINNDKFLAIYNYNEFEINLYDVNDIINNGDDANSLFSYSIVNGNSIKTGTFTFYNDSQSLLFSFVSELDNTIKYYALNYLNLQDTENTVMEAGSIKINSSDDFYQDYIFPSSSTHISGLFENTIIGYRDSNLNFQSKCLGLGLPELTLAGEYATLVMYTPSSTATHSYVTSFQPLSGWTNNENDSNEYFDWTIEYVDYDETSTDILSPSPEEQNLASQGGISADYMTSVINWRSRLGIKTTRKTYHNLYFPPGHGNKIYQNGEPWTDFETLKFKIDPSTSGNLRRTYYVLHRFTIPTSASRVVTGYQPLNGNGDFNGKSYYFWGYGNFATGGANRRSTEVYFTAPDNEQGWLSHSTIYFTTIWDTREIWSVFSTEVHKEYL